MKAKTLLKQRLGEVGEAVADSIDEAVADVLEPYLERLAVSDKRLAVVEQKVAVLGGRRTPKHVQKLKR